MKIIAYALVIFALLVGCKKNSNQPDSIDETSHSIDQDPMFIAWAKAANGRWVPYAMQRLDRKKLT